MADRTEAKTQGLRLNLPGAASAFHTIPGVPGYYHPDIPAPVGGPGQLDLAAARALADDESIHLELVPLTGPEAKKAQEAIDEFRSATRGDLAARTDGSRGREAQVLRDELTQTTTTPEG